MAFFSYPVNVNYQYISDTPTSFPAVTICKVQNNRQEIYVNYLFVILPEWIFARQAVHKNIYISVHSQKRSQNHCICITLI
jgi:hypothetical protein